MDIGSSALPVFPEAEALVRGRLNQLIEDLTAIHSLLIADRSDALGVAAQKLRDCGFSSWVPSTPGPAGTIPDRGGYHLPGLVTDPVWAAFASDVRPLKNEVARRLARLPAPATVRRIGKHDWYYLPRLILESKLFNTLVPATLRLRRPNAFLPFPNYALACALCGGDAVTFSVMRDCVKILVFPIRRKYERAAPYQANAWEGERGQELGRLLTGDDARGVVDLLAAGLPGPYSTRQCDAYCTECDRVYCRDHFSLAEHRWGEYWAICLFGHERELH